MVRAMVLAVMLTTASGHAWSQVSPAAPHYAMDPRSPLTPRAASPVQQQMLENYRTQLLQTQRDSLQQSPSGLGRDQLQIGGQLNAFGGPATVAPPTVAAPTPPFPAIPPGPLFNSAVQR
jgi:hypothetical protein